MNQNTFYPIIILNVLGWSCYSCADIISKYLSEDYHVTQLLMSSGALAGGFLAMWIFIKKGIKGFYSSKIKWHLLRALGVVGTSYCVLNAFSRIPLADFYGVAFTSPFLILILITIFLNENTGIHRWMAVIAGFIGVFILAGPEFATFNSGYIFAAASVFFVATTGIIIRKIGKDEYLPLYAVYPPLFIFVFNTPLAAMNYTPVPPPDYIWFVLFSSFIVGGLLMTTYSIAKAKEMALIAPFQYVQIIWGVVFGYFIFADVPTTRTYIGLSIVVAAGLYMIYREYRNHHPEKFTTPL